MLYKNITRTKDDDSKQNIIMIFYNEPEAQYIEKYLEQMGFDSQTLETRYQEQKRGYDYYRALPINMVIHNFFSVLVKLKDKLGVELPFMAKKPKDENPKYIKVAKNSIKVTSKIIKNHYECLVCYYHSRDEFQKLIDGFTTIKDKLDELKIESHGFNEMISNLEYTYNDNRKYAPCPEGFTFGAHVANAFVQLMALVITLDGYQFQEVVDTSIQRPMYDEDGNRTDLPVKLREEEKEIIKDAEKYSAELAERIQKAFERRNEDD